MRPIQHYALEREDSEQIELRHGVSVELVTKTWSDGAGNEYCTYLVRLEGREMHVPARFQTREQVLIYVQEDALEDPERWEPRP